MKAVRILAIVLAVGLLAGGVIGLTLMVRNRMQTTEYMFQVEAIFAASEVANQGEAVTDPERAVVANYQGQSWVVVPGNYRALSSYLRKDAICRLLGRVNSEEALHLVFCQAAEVWVQPVGAGDAVMIRLETGKQSFLVHAKGGNIWRDLLKVATTGTYHDENLCLSE